MASRYPTAAPRHVWVAGILSLLWNAYGCYLYVQSVTDAPSYVASLPPGMAEVLGSFPAWATGAYAVAVWASLAGSILLLARSRHAVTAFAISLVGAFVTFVHELTYDLPPALEGSFDPVMPIVITAAIVLQLWYAWWLAKRQVLR